MPLCLLLQLLATTLLCFLYKLYLSSANVASAFKTCQELLAFVTFMCGWVTTTKRFGASIVLTDSCMFLHPGSEIRQGLLVSQGGCNYGSHPHTRNEGQVGCPMRSNPGQTLATGKNICHLQDMRSRKPPSLALSNQTHVLLLMQDLVIGQRWTYPSAMSQDMFANS